MNVQTFTTPSGEEMVILPKAEYDALLVAANEAAEDAADVAAYDAAMATLNTENILPAEVSAAITKGDSRIRAIRKWRGENQVDTAAQLGISQGYLSDLETGRRQVTPDIVHKLAGFFNVPEEWVA